MSMATLNSIISTQNPNSFSQILKKIITAALIFSTIFYFSTNITETPTATPFKTSLFKFDVYCPTKFSPSIHKYTSAILNQNLVSLDQISSNLDTYLVYITALPSDSKNIMSPATIQYCGLARRWNDTCQNSRMVCSIPGPMFYLPVGEEINIIWLNSIDSTGLNWTEIQCYSPDSDDQFCSTKARDTSQSKNYENCTYYKPTDLLYNNTKKVRVSKDKIPVSPHIHGLETRPAFDGNPLAWFNNNGDRGVGFFSLGNDEYFKNFQQPATLPEELRFFSFKNMKIIKAKNKQSPGMLFYHDHSMRSTKYNVQMGLTGLYILYDKEIEKQLPSGKQEKIVLFAQFNGGDIRKAKISHHVGYQEQHKDSVFALKSEDSFVSSYTYRFRFINDHFDNSYLNISFVVYYEQISSDSGQNSIVELDPMNPDCKSIDILVDLSSNNHLLEFSVIGTDSSLLLTPVHGITQFDLTSAQRLDLLIKFDDRSGVPKGVNNAYLVCSDHKAKGIVLKNKFPIQKSSQPNKYKNPTDYIRLNIPFTNLSEISKQEIAITRNRALFSRPRNEKFIINGHYMYEMGQTENPKIGTIQDWNIINVLWEDHPMHFHLINCQIIKTYTLKIIPEGCTIYELDFFRYSGLPQFQNLNNSQLCHYLDSLTTSGTQKMYKNLYNYSPEDLAAPTKDGLVSGLNFLEFISNGQEKRNYILPNSDCSMNNEYKYVCEETTPQIPGYLRGWKDTVSVAAYSVSVIRIRWASTSYNKSVAPYPYFHIPEDQLVQFPGFLYHCHVLPHEDNQMMRPIMLEFSDEYLTRHPQDSKKACSIKNWSEKVKCINEAMGCKDLP